MAPPRIPHLSRQLHPSLHHPHLHLTRLLRLGTLSQKQIQRQIQILLHQPRNSPLLTHLRNMDAHPIHRPPLRCLLYFQSADLRDGILDVCGGVAAFHERVVGFWICEVGGGVSGAGFRGEWEFGVDVVSVGVLCGCLRGEGWRGERGVWMGKECV